MTKIKDEISKLIKQALNSPSLRNLERVNNDFIGMLEQFPKDSDLLFHYNEFRIASVNVLPRTRPQILIGGPFSVNFPNLHSLPLFEVADVICLTPVNDPFPYISTIQCHPSTLFFDILKKIPQGFIPDFFWDSQIEHTHYIPAGIHTAPFPIVGGVCHTYLHKSIEHVCELFDFVVANSKEHSKILKKKYPNKILDLPFGINCASFSHLLNPRWEKTIDVCVTFGETDSVVYFNKRNQVIESIKKFKEKYGNRYSILIFDRMPREEYFEVLRKSLITINVVAVNGPYNYRTIEAMNAGSMVFQYEWDDPFFENKFSELFIDGQHGVSFNFDNFESRLLYYLENREETKKIANQGYLFLNENYSFKKIYQDLIKIIKNNKTKILRNLESPYHQGDLVYYNQNNFMTKARVFGVLDNSNMLPWIRCNNLMVSCCELKEEELGYVMLVALSSYELSQIKHSEIWNLCCQFFKEALLLAPQELTWIIHWNFLLISLEKGQGGKETIDTVLSILENTQPTPFDEKNVIFKYYINSSLYPKYNLGNDEFIKLNLELMKHIDDPKKRAFFYHQYALTAISYFCERYNRKDND